MPAQNAPDQPSLMDILLGQQNQDKSGSMLGPAGASTAAPLPVQIGSNIPTDSSGNPTFTVSPPASPQQQPSPDVTPPVPQTPTPAGLNYDNSGAVQALQGALKGDQGQGGSANPGIYGLLPQNLQHGTLRNVLGALGDAFLVAGDKTPEYAANMQRQEVGNAMAGYDPNNPAAAQAAIQRVAASGEPGSADLADKMQTQYESAKMRQAQMGYTQVLHEQQNDSRNEAQLLRRIPYVGGMASSAKDAPSYQAAYQRAEAMAQQIGPSYHATDFGLVDPADWHPGMQFGLTANNQVVSNDKAAGRVQAGRDTDVNAGSRITAANINGGYHVKAAQIGADRPTEGTFVRDYIAKKQSGQATSPEEDRMFNHYSQMNKGGGGASLPAGLIPGGGGSSAAPGGGGGGIRTVTPSQAQSLPKGTHFRGTDGKMYIR